MAKYKKIICERCKKPFLVSENLYKEKLKDSICSKCKYNERETIKKNVSFSVKKIEKEVIKSSVEKNDKKSSNFINKWLKKEGNLLDKNLFDNEKKVQDLKIKNLKKQNKGLSFNENKQTDNNVFPNKKDILNIIKSKKKYEQEVNADKKTDSIIKNVEKKNIIKRFFSLFKFSKKKGKILEKKDKKNKDKKKFFIFFKYKVDIHKFLKRVLDLKLFLSKKDNQQKLIAGIIIIIPIILIFSIGYILGKSKINKEDYSLSFIENNFQNKKKSFYINEDFDSDKFGYAKNFNGEDVPSIKSSPLSFIWKPNSIPTKKDVTFSAIMSDDASWDISTFCENCDKENKYNWSTFYDSELAKYAWIQNVDGINIYSSSNQLQVGEKKENIENWLKKNISEYSRIKIIDNALDKKTIVNPGIEFKENSFTEFDNVLRGPHSFYVYLKDEMNLEIIKQDLNGRRGADIVNILLYDLNDNLIWQEEIEDDGIVEEEITEESEKIEIKKDFIKKDLEEGIYKIEFKETGSKILKDWVLKYFKINTNKVVVADKVLLLNPDQLYTEIKKPKDIEIYAWQKNSVQDIYFKGETNKEVFSISKDKLKGVSKKNLTQDNYFIDYQGNIELRGLNFAFNKESYFDPFIYDLNETEKPDLILSNVLVEKTTDGLVKVSKDIKKEEFEKLADKKRVNFILRNNDLRKNFDKNKKLKEEKFYQNSRFEKYILWSKGNRRFLSGQEENFKSWIEKNVSEKFSLNVNFLDDFDASLLMNKEEPNGFISGDDFITDLNFKLRGPHSFYVYVDDLFKTEITRAFLHNNTKSNPVSISLKNDKSEIVCQDYFQENETFKSFECGNLEKGTYLLNLEELPDKEGKLTKGYVFKNIKTNTNKIVVKDKIFNTEKIDIYANNQVDTQLDLYYYHQNKYQNIQVTHLPWIEVKSSDWRKHVYYELYSGPRTLSVPKGDIGIMNSNFAFNEENWFEATVVNLDYSEEKNYFLTKDIYNNPIYITNLEINEK